MDFKTTRWLGAILAMALIQTIAFAQPANDNCSGVIDLGTLTSPLSATTASALNDFGQDCLTNASAPDIVYSIDVPDGATLTIGQTVNAYDSKIRLAYGGGCPGTTLIACTDDPDISNETWTNTTGASETAYWTQSAYSNGSGTFTLAWNVSSCPDPTGLAASNVTSNSADVSFTAVAAGDHTVEYGPTGFTVGSGTTLTATAGTTTVTASGLSGSTTYDVYVTADCSNTAIGPVSLTTLNPPPTGPLGVSCVSGGSSAPAYADVLDDLSAWSGDIGTTGGQWRVGTSGTVSSGTGAGSPQQGAGFIYFEGSGGAGLTGTISSGPIDLSAFEDDAEASFYIHAFGGYIGTFTIGASSTAGGPFTPIYTSTGQFQGSSAAAWVQAAGNLSAYVGGDLYLEISHTALVTGTGDNWQSDFSIDNFVIEACSPAGTCAAPSSLSATTISDTEVELVFVGSGAAVDYVVEYGPSPLTAGTGTTATIAGSPATIGSLSPATTYDFFVTANCSSNSSTQVGPATATTDVAPPACGGNFYDSGGPSGQYSNNENETTTIFPTNPGDVVTVTFTAFDTEANYDDLTVYDGADASAPSLGTFDGTTIPGPFTSTDASGALTFVFSSDVSATRDGWEADVTCAPPPSCPAPTSLNAAAIIGSIDVELTFTDNASASSFIIEYGPTGFTPGTGTTSTASGSPATVSGLSAATAYDFYVSADCGGGSISSQTGPASATTTLDCSAALALACSTPVTAVLGTTGAYATNPCWSSPGEEALYTFTAANAGMYEINVTASDGYVDYVYGLASSGCNGPTMTCIDDITSTGTYPFGPLVAGETYFILLDNESGSVTRTHTFELTCPSPAIAPAAGCAGTVTATVDGSGTPAVVDFIDGSGDIYASIANTQNLGSVAVSLYGGTGPRTTAGGDFYLDRNIAIVPTTQPSAAIDVTIYVLNSEVTALINASTDVNSVNDLQFGKVSGTATCSAAFPGGADPVGLAATSYGTDWAFTGSVTSFSEFFVLPSAAPLPVELSSFTAYPTAQGNRVEWTAATEIDLFMYTVERASDPASFSAFADVMPTGTEYAEAVYTSQDLNPATTTYYRLRMEDLDGTVAYSDVVAVTRDDVRGGLTMFPNPAHEKVTFDLMPGVDAGNVTVVLTDLSGRTVREWSLVSGQRTDVSVSDIPSGVYMVTTVNASETQSQRLVID